MAAFVDSDPAALRARVDPGRAVVLIFRTAGQSPAEGAALLRVQADMARHIRVIQEGNVRRSIGGGLTLIMSGQPFRAWTFGEIVGQVRHLTGHGLVTTSMELSAGELGTALLTIPSRVGDLLGEIFGGAETVGVAAADAIGGVSRGVGAAVGGAGAVVEGAGEAAGGVGRALRASPFAVVGIVIAAALGFVVVKDVAVRKLAG